MRVWLGRTALRGERRELMSDILAPLARMSARVNTTKSDSDLAFFMDLLYFGELVLKLTTVTLLACVEDDRERHRYALEYELVRASGIGAWVQALEDVLVGSAAPSLSSTAYPFRNELTKSWANNEGSWEREAVESLDSLCHELDSALPATPARIQLRRWFAEFAWLRNRTRGHGAPVPAKCAALCERLETSLQLLAENLTIFKVPWAHLHRNLSGKFRVSSLGPGGDVFDYLKREPNHDLATGVYIFAGRPRLVPMLRTDADLSDFYVANGGYDGKSVELLSYITDQRTFDPAEAWQFPASDLPRSETQGHPILQVIGDTFTNLPALPDGYVPRPDLEKALREILLNDRHPIVTLVGRGGIGKTSLAISVLHALASSGDFFAIVWLSARDVDLLPQGPKLVQRQVATLADMASEFATLMNPMERARAGFRPLEYFAKALSGSAMAERLLFAFDNFETVVQPSDLYRWIDTQTRNPIKVLITTRSRDFKGDFPVEVSGMTFAEFETLTERTADRLGVGHLVTPEYKTQLFDESGGHPYVVKVLLGELARNPGHRAIDRIMAAQDQILDALFERTYSALAPTDQRVFLTLCAWRSVIPKVALEATLMRPLNERMDVEAAVSNLERASMIEISTSSGDGQYFLSVPLAAALFGRRRLEASPIQVAVAADLQILRAFGAATASDVAHGIGPRIARFFQYLAERLSSETASLGDYAPVVEYIARAYPKAWLQVAELYSEHPSAEARKLAPGAIRQYVESTPDDPIGWSKLAEAYRSSRDALGEIHARLRLSELSTASFREISETANRLNSLLRDGSLKVDTDEKRIIAQRLHDVMVARVGGADATDLSRLGWLCIHLGRPSDALTFAQRGLQMDPNNEYCARLADRTASGRSGKG